MMSLLKIARYAADFFGITARYRNALPRISGEAEIVDYLRQKGGLVRPVSGLVGAMIFDMAVPDADKEKRLKVGEATSLACLMVCIADDVVDDVGISMDGRMQFLDELKSDLFGYSLHNEGGVRERAAYALARHLEREFFSVYRSDAEVVFDDLTDAVKRQFVEKNPSNLLGLEKRAGGLCFDIMYAFTCMVADREDPYVREACRQLGSYGQMLDDFADIDENLMEGTNTYATAVIRQDGDFQAVRDRIRAVYFDQANNAINSGADFLDARQKKIYGTIKSIIDLKYRSRWGQLPTLQRDISFASVL